MNVYYLTIKKGIDKKTLPGSKVLSHRDAENEWTTSVEGEEEEEEEKEQEKLTTTKRKSSDGLSLDLALRIEKPGPGWEKKGITRA